MTAKKDDILEELQEFRLEFMHRFDELDKKLVEEVNRKDGIYWAPKAT